MNPFFHQLFTNYLVFFIFFCVGLIEFSIVFFIWYARKKISSKGYDAKATVVDVVAANSGKGIMYKPVFGYTTYLNEKMRVASTLGSAPNYYPVGAEVEIFYNPDKPSRFIIKNDKRFRIAFLTIGIISGAFLLMGLSGIIFLYFKIH